MARVAPDAAWQAYLQEKATLAIADAFSEAMVDATSKTASVAIEIASLLRSGVAPEEFSRAHERIARRAQKSILSSYDQTVTARRGSAGRYRVGAPDRLAGGVLRKALASPEMVSWGPKGFTFLNVEMLDREAAHWARLNAGALPAGRGSRRQFEVRFSNLVVGAIGLNMTPSPPFYVPTGFWLNPTEGTLEGPNAGRRGSDQFYPARQLPGGAKPRPGEKRPVRQRRRLSRGIEARNFLDAGYATVARELGPTYERVYRELWRKKIGQIRPGRSVSRGFRTIRAY